MAKQSAKNRRRIAMAEWEVSVRFGCWLVEKEACSAVTVIPPKGKKGIERVKEYLLTNGWEKEQDNEIAFRRNFGNIEKKIFVSSRDGQGDVRGFLGYDLVIAECKGFPHANCEKDTRAIFNSCVGQCLLTDDTANQVYAVFPLSDWFECQASKAIQKWRVGASKIQFAFVTKSEVIVLPRDHRPATDLRKVISP